MSKRYLCDSCGMRFKSPRARNDIISNCSCVAQPQWHGKVSIRDGQKPREVCKSYEGSFHER